MLNRQRSRVAVATFQKTLPDARTTPPSPLTLFLKTRKFTSPLHVHRLTTTDYDLQLQITGKQRASAAEYAPLENHFKALKIKSPGKVRLTSKLLGDLLCIIQPKLKQKVMYDHCRHMKNNTKHADSSILNKPTLSFEATPYTRE